jgi:Na+/proline symporter
MIVTELRDLALISFPEGLHQHDPATMADVMHYIGFIVLSGLMVYIGVFCDLLILTRIFSRRSIKTLHKAATVIAAAFVFCWPAILLAHLALGDGNTFGVVEVGLMMSFAIAALVIAIRIVWKGDRQLKGQVV